MYWYVDECQAYNIPLNTTVITPEVGDYYAFFFYIPYILFVTKSIITTQGFFLTFKENKKIINLEFYLGNRINIGSMIT